VGGCGKFFEGTAAEMYPSLYEKIGDLPDDTLLWPGHEYTVSNLTFAARVEPTNSAVQRKLAWAQEKRAEKAFTVPSTVGEEKQHNVFLRCNCSSLRAACSLDEGASPIDCLAALRELKNSGK
jgi:hydroxyacylglutathione hydrolase